MEQIHIKSAFLNGDLNEEIWMLLPPGIGLDGKILLLHKSLYGLKQSPLQWFDKLASVLAELGFVSLAFDPCVFINTNLKVILVVYVDDITTVGASLQIKVLIDHLKTHFKLTIKGGLKYILGIEVTSTEHGLELSQRQYITNILERFGMENCRPVSTPIDPKAPLVKADGSEPPHERTAYQEIIGSLVYLITCTRPDLTFSDSFLSRFSSHLLKSHHTAIKRVFRNLTGTQNVSLIYHRLSTAFPLMLTGYSDTDYTSCCDPRRCVTSYVFMLNGCAISWLSKK